MKINKLGKNTIEIVEEKKTIKQREDLEKDKQRFEEDKQRIQKEIDKIDELLSYLK